MAGNDKIKPDVMLDIRSLILIVPLFCLTLPERLLAAEVVLLGSSDAGVFETNSVVADVSIENGIALSSSATDSHISFTPFSEAWHSVESGTLLCDLAVVSDASNQVSVLFGDYCDPALTVVSGSDWQILPAGVLPQIQTPEGSECGPATNRLEFVMRVSELTKNGKIAAKTAVNSGAPSGREDLSLTSLNWHSEAQLPENWRTITLQLAGSEARILRFRIKYRPDELRVIVR